MSNVSDFLRSGNSNLSLHEILQQPPSVLLGVSDASTILLSALGIESVFDLGASRIFAQADSALAATSSTTGSLPNDLLKPDNAIGSLDEIPMLPLTSLRGISNSLAEQLETALDVLTLRDFSFWPPRQVAKKLVAEASGGSTLDDVPDGDRLRPQLGQYPTERVYYDSLFMLDSANSENLTPLENPLSLEDIVANPVGFGKPALGALATYSQSWFAQGITLGHMVHSLALAPGEATRVAVVDWSRRSRAASTESISESESLSNSMDHSRAISEVQNAVAQEMQEGESMSSGWANSKSKGSGVAGSLGGGVAGVISEGVTGALGLSIGGSSTKQSSETEFGASSTSWSSGNRSVLSQMDQTVNDRTEQHATSVRNRRATAVREVSQSEHEQVSTRVVANYNHMHALTVQYYEVVQLYRVATQLHKFQRALFLPFQLLDFSGVTAANLISRFRGQLLSAALTSRIRDILLDERGRVEIRAGVHVPIPTSVLDTLGIPAVATAVLATANMGTTSPGTASPDTNSPRPGAAAGPPRTVIRPGAITEVAPADAKLVGISFSGVGVDRVRLEHAGIPTTVDVPGTDHVALATEIPLNTLESISVVRNGLSALVGTMDLRYEVGGRPEKVTLPISLHGVGHMQKVAFFTADASDRREELLTHLQANRAYYTQAVFENLDSASLVMLLSGTSWNGKPLADQVEPNPIAVAGNFLILRAPVEPQEVAGIGDNGITWAELLKERGVSFESSNLRLIPVPTGGVFAEAVLGRSNSAEKLDLTRFWNWQDSPIPLQPTEIAPINVGTRAMEETLTPGQLSSPVLNIQTPVSLPEPAGLSAILEVLANGSLFRDMSGLQGTQAAGQAAGMGTLDAATAAGQIASTNFQAATKQATEMARIAADMWKVLQKSNGEGGDNSTGVSEDGARINHGKDMDDRGVPSTSSQPSESSAASSNPNTTKNSGGRERAYSDQAALGYSPDGMREALDSAISAITPVFAQSSEITEPQMSTFSLTSGVSLNTNVGQPTGGRVLIVNFGTFFETSRFKTSAFKKGFLDTDVMFNDDPTLLLKPKAGMILKGTPDLPVLSLNKLNAKTWESDVGTSDEPKKYREGFREWFENVLVDGIDCLYLTGHSWAHSNLDSYVVSSGVHGHSFMFTGKRNESELDIGPGDKREKFSITNIKASCKLIFGFGCKVATSHASERYQTVFGRGANDVPVICGWNNTMSIPKRNENSVIERYFEYLEKFAEANGGPEKNRLEWYYTSHPLELMKAWGFATHVKGKTNARARGKDGLLRKMKFDGTELKNLKFDGSDVVLEPTQI